MSSLLNLFLKKCIHIFVGVWCSGKVIFVLQSHSIRDLRIIRCLSENFQTPVELCNVLIMLQVVVSVNSFVLSNMK